MTQLTPPGWYPDPGQTQDGPATERWWDGKAWTDRVRPSGPAAAWSPPGQPPAAGGPPGAPAAAAGAAEPVPGAPGAAAGPPGPPPGVYGGAPGAYGAAPGTYPVHPDYPGYPVQPSSGRRRGLRTAAAVAAAVVVLTGIGAGVYLLTDDGGPAGSSADSSRREGPRSGDGNDPFGGPDGGGSPAPDSPGRSEPPTVDSGSVPDPVNGISLPVPDGWSGQRSTVGAAVTSDDSYRCPGDTSETCTKGGAYSVPAMVLGTKGSTPEEVAKADIAANAEESYGGKPYGGITSHQELASKAVTVAGQKGYLVRWKAVTGKGSDGFVQSLAFPSPADAKRIVVVRFGVDVEERESVLDEITEGIEVSSGGGTGQDV